MWGGVTDLAFGSFAPSTAVHGRDAGEPGSESMPVRECPRDRLTGRHHDLVRAGLGPGSIQAGVYRDGCGICRCQEDCSRMRCKTAFSISCVCSLCSLFVW